MKKILSFVVMALAMSLAFTSCASKKANEKGPTTYRVDLGSAADVIEVGNKKQLINVSAQLSEKPVAGDNVRISWTAYSDKDIGKIYVSCVDKTDDIKELNLSEEAVVLAEGVQADNAFWISVSVPLELDVDGDLCVYIWSDTEAVCTKTYIDAK